ncbi:hypothetical protein AB0P23_17165 [Rhodococcus sp. NPDC077669]|uniref:hypothetical protein n=1 Tax=Rhodococcus sp. NPDC077669 TaxID=3155174 RepID=UPI00341AE4A2
MDSIERAAIVDEGYDPDDPDVHAAMDHVSRLLAAHRHLTADPELSIDHVVDASKAHDSRWAPDVRR